MSESIATARLRNPTQAWKSIIQVWKVIKGWLIGNGGELEIDVRKATRTSKQNRLLHAMLGDIARQKEWAGQKRDTETWKRLLTAAWCRARNEHIEMLPALDGHGVDIVFRRTSQLSRAECAELCDYIGAWCAANGVKLKEARQWTDEEIDAETGEIMEHA